LKVVAIIDKELIESNLCQDRKRKKL